MTMKKIFALMTCAIIAVTCTALTFALTGCSVHAKAGKELKIAGHGLMPPISFLDGNNKLVGIESDLARIFAADMNKGFKIDLMSPDACFAAVASGTHDISIGWTITDKRKQAHDFTDPFISSNYMFITKQSDDTFNDKSKKEILAAMNGKRIGAYSEAEHINFVQSEVAGATAVPFDNLALMVIALRNGQIDYILWELLISEDDFIMTDLFTINTDIKPIMTPIVESQLAIIVRKGNTSLLNKLNESLERIKSSGELDTIFAKYV